MSTATSTPAETPDGLPLPSPIQPDPLSMAAVLRIVPMRRMWYAQIVSVLGDFLALFAVIEVITFNLHANAQQVTGLQIAYLLPSPSSAWSPASSSTAGRSSSRSSPPTFSARVFAFALSSGMLLLLALAGKLWMEPKPHPSIPVQA